MIKVSILFFLKLFYFAIHLTYSRKIYYDGDIYEGGYNMRDYHGKGEWEYYKDGRIEKGSWVNDLKQGEFEVTYKDGTTHKVMYKDDERVEQ